MSLRHAPVLLDSVDCLNEKLSFDRGRIKSDMESSFSSIDKNNDNRVTKTAPTTLTGPTARSNGEKPIIIPSKPDIDETGIQDFFWSYTEEPHRTRRREIIRAHPEVTKLCGPEPWTKWVVLAVTGLQLSIAYYLRNLSPFSPFFIGIAYVIGATANQNVFLSIHELSHNLAFKSPRANRLFAIFANLPIGVPYSAAFRPYHLTHHKSLGVDGLDTDLPTALEAIVLDSVLGKAFFCTFQLLFYAVRPMMVYTIPFSWLHVLNVAAQILFDVAVVWFVGWRAMAYLLMSSFLAGSLHPCAGHFIAEHYVFEKCTTGGTGHGGGLACGQPIPDTYSYYGPLNLVTYNVGLHNEHHDFPAIPWTRLPKLNKIANEFYRDLPYHRSWVWVMWQFVMDNRVGLWCRVKRDEAANQRVANK